MLTGPCDICGKAFKEWVPGKFVRAQHLGKVPEKILIPDCDCLSQENERAYQDNLKAVADDRARQRFKAIAFESHDIPEAATMPLGDWENPVAEILKGNKYVIIGPSGSSKTTPVKLICLKLCWAGAKVRGGYTQWVLDSLKDMNKIGERMAELLDGDVLVLDDLDKPTMTEYEVDRLMSVVNHYDAPGRSILVTLNTGIADLERKLFKKCGGDESATAKSKAIISRLTNRALIIVQGADSGIYRVESEVKNA